MGNLNNTTLQSDRFIVPNNYIRYRSCSDQFSTKMLPMMQRLNSVGEDIDLDQGKYTSLQSVGVSMSKIIQQLRDSSSKSSSGLRPEESTSRYRSMPISMTLNTNEPNKGKLLKSHSLPEVTLREGLYLNQDFMHFNHKPDRSWSFGSYGGEQTFDSFKHLDTHEPNLNRAVHFFRTFSEPRQHCAFNALIHPQGQRVIEGLGHLCNKSQENNKEEHLSFCSSTMSNLVQSKKSCATISMCKGIHIDHVKSDMAKADASKSVDQSSSSKRPSSTMYVSGLICSPHEPENESEDSEISADHSSILYSPRKTCKKGRPSSKKQRKRRRQKQKHALQTSSVDDGSASDTFNESSEKQECSNISYSCGYKSDSSVINSSKYVNTSLSQNISTPIKSNSNHPVVKNFFSNVASSESEDSESDEGENCDWSQADDSENNCAAVNKGKTFGVALNLDSIFKQQHVPSLESLLSNECSDDSPAASPSKGSNLDLCSFSLSEEDVDDSIEFAASSPLTSFVPEFQLNTSDSIEDNDVTDAFVEEDVDLEPMVDMHEVNNKWNEMYSSPGICSCCTKNMAVGASKAVMKVNFLDGPELLTVHTVLGIESEDRAGTWHHYALDRERFQRRIQEASLVLLPILDGKHRSAIAQRNSNLLKSWDKPPKADLNEVKASCDSL
ncbi:hypothetical protein EGW08_015188 [Elysia chlorotica]|uniref:Protein phosphatase 1 regulatory subunit 15A/B C-terminal domain-containing protein n=1 Tax=Elysia chlorotica TaxID=188477 RepID=A0A3S1BBX7_ELYCH|nr:hypothetical protein EGW08_015188 [Elysia chlorotica]